VKGEFIMRRFALVIAAAGLVTLTACGTTVTGRAVPAQAGTVTDLSYLVSSRTAAEHTVHFTYAASTNLPVRVGFSENVTRAGTTTKLTVNMTYTQWGAPVRIQAPPADQIGPLPAH
jgi:hypothetical protein